MGLFMGVVLYVVLYVVLHVVCESWLTDILVPFGQ